jgi:hypothetical protein
MAVRLGGTRDDAVQVRSGTLSATGVMATPFIDVGSRWNLSIWGAFVATLRLVRSFDGGTTWIPCTVNGDAVTFSGPATEVVDAPEAGVIYALEVLTYTSGPVNWRASR